MTMKIAVSLPDDLVAEARRAVSEGRAASVSAYVAEALTEKSRRRTLGEVLDEMDAALGPPDERSRTRAERALDLLERG